jgi:site-specific DNA-methyltransferase (adenine-specific)
MNLHKGDCLEVMKTFEDNSIDAIITDPPYGTTQCKWDNVIDFKLMWEQLNRIIKPNGAIVLFGSEPFSSALRISNIKNYKYDWIWHKNQGSGHLNAKIMPMKYHEIISVFGNKINFNPIGEEYAKSTIKRIPKNKEYRENLKEYTGDQVYGKFKDIKRLYVKKEGKSPSSVQFFKTVSGTEKQKVKHPTQKPLDLMEYLIKTYTNKNEMVLDFTMGSGSTGVACVNTNRNFTGIEMDDAYFEIAKNRIDQAQLTMF